RPPPLGGLTSADEALHPTTIAPRPITAYHADTYQRPTVYNPKQSDLPEQQEERLTSSKPPRVAVNIDAIPAELKERKQWVYWRYKITKDRDDWTKVPVNVKTGTNASSTEPDQWASFE